MNWKQRISIILTFILVAGLIPWNNNLIISHAEENEASSDSKGDSSDAPEATTATKKEEQDSSSGSGSDSSGSSEESSSDSSGSDGSSSDQEDSDGSDSSDSESSSEDGSSTESSSKAEGSSETEGATEEKSEESSTETTEEVKKEEEKKAEKRKVVEDDSNGRDYQASEVVSSGNTTFTIVSVARNEDELNAQLKKMNKKLKKQLESLNKYQELHRSYQEEINDIRAIYTMIYQTKPQVTQMNLYLMGCRIDGSFTEKKDCVNGMDQALSDLADKYNNEELQEWTNSYSTEYMPQAIQMSLLDEEENDLYSNAEPLLQDMLASCTTELTENQGKIDTLQKEIADTKEHIEKIEAAKKASIIELDSRLLDYKDIIPDPCVPFLNAVVAKEGTPYVWGASGPNSFDCSGLVSYGLRECNAVSSGFRWTSHDFASQLKSVSFNEALPGDLVWKSGHIAIYIDANTVFEAPYTGAKVRFTSCDVSSRFKRVLRWWSEEDTKKDKDKDKEASNQ